MAFGYRSDDAPAFETRRGIERGAEEASPGYALNGTSMWERQAAHGGSVDTKPTRERQEWSRLDVLLKHELDVIAAERRAAAGDAKAIRNLAKTRAFLERLRAEQRAAVTDIPRKIC